MLVMGCICICIVSCAVLSWSAARTVPDNQAATAKATASPGAKLIFPMLLCFVFIILFS